MKKLIHIFFVIIFLSYSIKADWHPQSSGTTANLNSVYFPVLNTGYIAGGNGTILKTTDGGASWIPKISGTISSLYSVYFLNANTGFAVGDNVILKTTDGGNTWSSRSTNFSLKSIYMVNSNLGFAAGTGGSILRTTNGGESWTVNIIETIASFTSIYFSNINTGHVVGLGGRYFKTTNGGITWINKVPPSTKNYYSVQFVDGYTGYITGGWAASTIMSSNNGGDVWNELLSGASGIRLYTSCFLDEYTGYVAGRNGVIMKTENAGVNWQNENTGTTEYLYSINFVTPAVGYAVGANGKILSTVNLIGIQPVSNEIPKSYSLSQNYPNPFNPSTKIKFDIPSVGNAYMRSVQIKIYDILGREVTSLVNEQLKPGYYEISFDASNYPSGVYFYKLQAGEFSESKKMVLIK